MRVEFFGVARERAGVSALEVQADTLGQLLGTLATQVPSLCPPACAGKLHSAFAASLNGDRFVSDPGTQLAIDDCVLVLSADAGG